MGHSFSIQHALRGAIVILLGACLAAAAGCVSKGSYEDLRAERDALAKANAELEQQLAVTETEVVILGTELDSEREVFAAERATYDNLLARLSVEVAAGEIAVEQMQSGVNVRISEEVLFGSGSARVDEGGVEVIKKLAEGLQEIDYQIVVGGYTDDVPIGGNLAETYPTNWDLAGARAARVVSVLETNGIATEQLLAVSFGESNPVASNDTAEGRAQNRRIEVRIRPVEIDTPAVAAGPSE